MAEPRTWDNLNVSEGTPTDAMPAFMVACGFGLKDFRPQYTKKGLTAHDKSAEDDVLVPQINEHIAHIIFKFVKEDSAAARKGAGLDSPLPSPRQTETPRAPPAPTRPPRLAVAQAPGQAQATAVRELFADVPAGAPDAQLP